MNFIVNQASSCYFVFSSHLPNKIYKEIIKLLTIGKTTVTRALMIMLKTAKK